MCPSLFEERLALTHTQHPPSMEFSVGCESSHTSKSIHGVCTGRCRVIILSHTYVPALHRLKATECLLLLSLSLSHSVSLLHTLSVCVIMGGMHTEAIFGAGGIWKLCFPARAWYYYTKMKSKAESHANAHTVHAKDTHIHTQFRQKLERTWTSEGKMS